MVRARHFLLVAVAALLANAPALDGAFVYDDRQYVVDNPVVRGEAPLWGSSLGDPDLALWRPLTVATWRAQWTDPPAPRPFLVVNLALHVVTALLVVLVGRRLGLGPGAATVGGLLFAVHPIHAEAVAWVTGRAELLAALGVLAAWWAHLDARPGRAWLALPLVLLAGLSKENALVAPALFAVADLGLARAGPLGAGPAQRPVPWVRLAALGLGAAGLFALRLAVLPTALPVDGPYHETGVSGRAGVALSLVGQALRLLVLPWPLRIHYDRLEFLGTQPLLLALAGGLAVAVVLLWRRERRAAVLLALIPVALLPVLHLLPMGEPFAERFLYLPSAPFCLAAGVLLARLAERERAGRGLGLSLLLGAGALLAGTLASREACARFRSDLALWAHAARVTPQLAVVRYNHATFLERAGRFATLDDHALGVEDELAASLELHPNHPYAAWARQTLGHLALGALGPGRPNPREAARHYREALALDPTLVDARQNLASLALTSPGLVAPEEALALLEPLRRDASLAPERRAAVDQLLGKLSASSSNVDGSGTPTSGERSSPDGS